MKANRLNKLLGIGILFAMWMPMVINHSGIFKKLYVFGVVPEKKVENPSWMKGTAQQQFENELMESSVAKTYLLRIRNQYQYSLFHKINATDIYENGDYLFRFYHYSFNEDHNFIGEDSLKQCVDELKELQTILGKDIPIITIIAPNKSRYFSEFLNDRNKTKTKRTNYDYLLKYMEEAKLPIIDFNDYFIQHPSKTPAIFAKGGIHWTRYAATVAMDSVVNYLSALKGEQFNQFTFTTEECEGFDIDDLDIALLRNLMVRPKDEHLRKVKIQSKNNGKKIKAIIVGDSFFTVIQTSDLRKTIFTKDTDFHYYFTTTFDANYQGKPVDIQKIKTQLKDADCVIILSEIVNLEKFGFGFQQALVKDLTID